MTKDNSSTTPKIPYDNYRRFGGPAMGALKYERMQAANERVVGEDYKYSFVKEVDEFKRNYDVLNDSQRDEEYKKIRDKYFIKDSNEDNLNVLGNLSLDARKFHERPHSIDAFDDVRAVVVSNSFLKNDISRFDVKKYAPRSERDDFNIPEEGPLTSEKAGQLLVKETIEYSQAPIKDLIKAEVKDYERSEGAAQKREYFCEIKTRLGKRTVRLDKITTKDQVDRITKISVKVNGKTSTDETEDLKLVLGNIKEASNDQLSMQKNLKSSMKIHNINKTIEAEVDSISAESRKIQRERGAIQAQIGKLEKEIKSENADPKEIENKKHQLAEKIDQLNRADLKIINLSILQREKTIDIINKAESKSDERGNNDIRNLGKAESNKLESAIQDKAKLLQKISNQSQQKQDELLKDSKAELKGLEEKFAPAPGASEAEKSSQQQKLIAAQREERANLEKQLSEKIAAAEKDNGIDAKANQNEITILSYKIGELNNDLKKADLEAKKSAPAAEKETPKVEKQPEIVPNKTNSLDGVTPKESLNNVVEKGSLDSVVTPKGSLDNVVKPQEAVLKSPEVSAQKQAEVQTPANNSPQPQQAPEAKPDKAINSLFERASNTFSKASDTISKAADKIGDKVQNMFSRSSEKSGNSQTESLLPRSSEVGRSDLPTPTNVSAGNSGADKSR